MNRISITAAVWIGWAARSASSALPSRRSSCTLRNRSIFRRRLKRIPWAGIAALRPVAPGFGPNEHGVEDGADAVGAARSGSLGRSIEPPRHVGLGDLIDVLALERPIQVAAAIDALGPPRLRLPATLGATPVFVQKHGELRRPKCRPVILCRVFASLGSQQRVAGQSARLRLGHLSPRTADSAAFRY